MSGNALGADGKMWVVRVMNITGGAHLRNLFNGFGEKLGRDTSFSIANPDDLVGFAATLEWAKREFPDATLTKFDPILREYPEVDVTRLVPGRTYTFISLNEFGLFPTRAEVYASRRQRRLQLRPVARDDVIHHPLSSLPHSLRESIAIAPKGCWIWMGSTSLAGYGMARWQGKSHAAHRLIFALLQQEMPKDAHACHRCDVRLCVNPAHLYIGNVNSNWDDRRSRKHGPTTSAHFTYGPVPKGLQREQVPEIRRRMRRCRRDKARTRTLARAWNLSHDDLNLIADNYLCYGDLPSMRRAYHLENLSVHEIALRYAIPDSIALDVIEDRIPGRR